WRDVVLLVCVVLFTIIWWDVDHSRSNWLPMFVLLIILTIVTAAYAFRRRPPVDQRLEGPIRHQRGPAPASSTSTAASMLGMIVGP
ncbi:MAG: hypothetical protein ACXVX4_12570, partial [Mycobacterium sp.]